jgi:hypothetical protein
MATTTNYAWETPDDTDLVKDGALAIRTLGSSIDTTTKALNPSTTLGDIEYRSATANTNTRLAIGTTGQVLTVAGGVPTWASAAGSGGKVLQVVAATTSTRVTVASTTYTDSGLTATITPSLSTSKILVLTSQSTTIYSDANLKLFGVRLMRDSTAIFNDISNPEILGNTLVNAAGQAMAYVSYSYLDSPATTSATTYKTQGRVYSTANNTEMDFQRASATSSIILLEIGA